MKEISQKIIAQNEEIELFRNSNPLSVAKMLYDEALELVEATETAFLTDDLTSIASEVADVFYLLVRFSELLGLDIVEATEIKIKRNLLKYGGQTSVPLARENWESKGGDRLFFDKLLDE